MLPKLFSGVCGSNEGLRRSTFTMPDSISSQSPCYKVSEKWRNENATKFRPPLLKSRCEVTQKAATASSSTPSIHVASYNQIARRKKRNVIDLKTKMPSAVQMMQYNVQKIPNSPGTGDRTCRNQNTGRIHQEPR